MKKILKKCGLLLFALLISFSTISIKSNATEVENKSDKNIELRADVLPRKIYISNKSKFFYGNSLPPMKWLYSDTYYGVEYEGYLTLVSFQNVVNGYLAFYSGYIYRK